MLKELNNEMYVFPFANQLRFAIGQAMATGIRAIGADEGSLLLAPTGSRSLVFAIVADADGAIADRDTALLGKTVPIGEGVTGMAAFTRDVQSAADGDGGVQFHRVRGDGKPHAVLAAPVLYGDTLLGVLTAVSFSRRTTFTCEHGRTYGMSANAVAGLLHYAAESQHGAVEKWHASRACDLTGAAALLHETREFSGRHPDRIEAMRRIVREIGTIL